MSDPAFKAMSIEEYLRTEAKSPYKREYVGGFVYALHGQAGATEPHVLICGNIFGTLHSSSKGSGCRVYQSEMRLYLDERGAYYYPDVMVVCDPDDKDRLAKTRPCLLVEVLSKSTAANDRLGKYAMYTAIPSLQTYLIVEQDERRVYAYSRENSGWQMRELIGEGDIHLPCLGRSLSLGEIYDGVL